MAGGRAGVRSSFGLAEYLPNVILERAMGIEPTSEAWEAFFGFLKWIEIGAAGDSCTRSKVGDIVEPAALSEGFE
jgi:hypothetical protein